MNKSVTKTSSALLVCCVASLVMAAVGLFCAFICLRDLNAAGARVLPFWILTGVLAALAVLAAVVYRVNIRTIVRPTLEMEAHFARIAGGDLHTECPLEESLTEIGQLVKSANTMQRTFSRYILSIENVLHALGRGELSVKTDQAFTGDFVRIRDALEQITASFADSFAEINTAAAEVSSGAEQISTGASTLSEGSSEQAATIEELVSTMTEVSQRVADTVTNAEAVRAAAANMMNVINKGNQSLSLLAGHIEKTGAYSSDINKIIKVIDNVAFQTNILALNAAVEAARAGENGAAFGVVADEIRALSTQTTENAKVITSLIGDMQESFSAGVAAAKATEGSLEAIVMSADEVEKLVSRITETMESDSAAVEESLASLEQLSAVVQTSSATAEESAATSQEIAAQAYAVMELVSKFKK